MNIGRVPLSHLDVRLGSVADIRAAMELGLLRARSRHEGLSFKPHGISNRSEQGVFDSSDDGWGRFLARFDKYLQRGNWHGANPSNDPQFAYCVARDGLEQQQGKGEILRSHGVGQHP